MHKGAESSLINEARHKQSTLGRREDNEQIRESAVSSDREAKIAPGNRVASHRSVRSISKEIEVIQSANRAIALEAKENTQNLITLVDSQQDLIETSGTPSSAYNCKAPTNTHNRRPQRTAVLLASASYPSTLSTRDSSVAGRQRTVSSSSITAGISDKSSSLKLASAAYPSSYSTSALPNTPSLYSPAPLPAQDSKMVDRTTSSKAIPTPMLPTLSVSLEDDGDQRNGAGHAGSDGEGTGEEEEEDQVGELSLSPSSPVRLDLSKMTPAERREHSRKHSRVHSRNLSVFFPRPGSEAEKEFDDDQAAKNFGKPSMIIRTDLTESDEQIGRGESSGASLSPSKSRRGHHRRHSVNHGLLNTSALGAGADLPSPAEPASPWPPGQSDESHRAVLKGKDQIKDDFNRAPALAKALSTPLSRILRLSSLPASHRPLLLFGCLEFVLGAMLWWRGQSGDSLSLTGLGYLVVFDAFGILNVVAAEWLSEGWRRQEEPSNGKEAFRKPYGPYRIETVLQFSQTVYLLFASIYVCKESVEHALLEGAEEHHEEDDIGLQLPKAMLLLTTASSLFTSMILHNHSKLVAACGIATSATDNGAHRRGKHGRRNSILVDPGTLAGPFLHLLSNPFSITILFFSATLALASLIMPAFQVAALDKVLAGLESVAMLYIAYPASVALGKILLQTAPKAYNTQNVQLLRSLQTIGEHPLVTYTAPPHLWQLTPPTAATMSSKPAAYRSTNSNSLLGSQRVAKNAALIATVEIFLKDEATDENILQITKWAWTLLAPAVGAGAGMRAGESLRGSVRAGELCVSVSREDRKSSYRRAEQALHGDAHCHHGHGHEHDHGHEHGHDHSHQTHVKSHAHDHTHDHNHNHHDHSHSHNHDHNHNHHHADGGQHNGTYKQTHQSTSLTSNGTHTHSH